jgi:hypothetical protein
MVLPAGKIKEVCQNTLEDKSIGTVLDFGAGTLFWSSWFVKKFKSRVCAVDTYYDKTEMPEKDGITCYADFNKCLETIPWFSLVWACDVLHHLPPEETQSILEKIVDKTNIIIIKDIDANHTFGNIMNKLHDRIINGENVFDIFPNDLRRALEPHGFEMAYYYLPKIWYPHFMVTALRG